MLLTVFQKYGWCCCNGWIWGFSRHENKTGYYIVNFTSVPYMLQEDFDVDGKIIESGELVGGDVYLYPLDSTGWRRNTPKAEYAQEVTVALCTVLHT